MKLALNKIFKTYEIRPHQYHGGNFLVNNVRIFMAEAKEICSDIDALFNPREKIIVLTNEQ